MYQPQAEIQEIKKSILKKFRGLNIKEIKIDKKEDLSIVTEVDLYISELTRDIFKKSNSNLNFFCEENQDSFRFPLLTLDPIDGTKGLSQGLPECAISLAILNTPNINDPNNFGWIYNPFTGFEVSTQDLYIRPSNPQLLDCLTGIVSRSEWNNGLFNNDHFKQFQLIPRGSIALKLGLLASGVCDFVFSLRPKHIWDIAAGTLIANSRGLEVRSFNRPLNELNQKIYSESLLWGDPYHLSQFQEKYSGTY